MFSVEHYHTSSDLVELLPVWRFQLLKGFLSFSSNFIYKVCDKYESVSPFKSFKIETKDLLSLHSTDLSHKCANLLLACVVILAIEQRIDLITTVSQVTRADSKRDFVTQAVSIE